MTNRTTVAPVNRGTSRPATTRRLARALVATALVAVALAGCTRSTGGDTDVEVANQAGQEVASPSADHTASLQPAGDENGVQMLAVMVTDADGQEVFRSETAYSTRHGVGIAWQLDGEVLWVLSSDLGTSRIESSEGGAWSQTWLTPQTRDDVPPEIAALR